MAAELERIFLGKTKGQLRKTLAEITQPGTGMTENRYPSRLSTHIRTPDILTTRSWLSKGEYIPLYINPSATNWTITRRESIQKTAAGFVRNTWRNRSRNTYFDDIPIQFTFQTGNIMPSSGVNIDLNDPERILRLVEAPQIPPGLNNFYKYLGLIDQGALAGTGANYHIVVYHSRVFPQLWLEGFFDPQNSAAFGESADNGNTVTWQATFICTRTVPRLSSTSVMQGLYTDWLTTSGAINEQLPIELAKTIRDQKAALDKIFADWGFGGMPQDGASKKDPTKVMQSQKSDPKSFGTFGKLPYDYEITGTKQGLVDPSFGGFNNDINVGTGTIGQLDPKTGVATAGQSTSTSGAPSAPANAQKSGGTYATTRVISQQKYGNANPNDRGPMIWDPSGLKDSGNI